MYEAFYNFTGTPFQLTPDSRFFFGSRGHSKAIAHLNFGLAQGEGFIIITGEVGAGKTTIVEWLRTQVDPSTYTMARVSTTQVSENDLFRLAMAGFGVEDEGLGKAALLRRFEGVLREHQAAGRRCLLIVDEVQNLSLAALEEFGPDSQSGLSDRTGIYRSDLVATINDLTVRGLVVRTPDPADRRRNAITLTDDGRRHLKQLDELLEGER